MCLSTSSNNEENVSLFGCEFCFIDKNRRILRRLDTSECYILNIHSNISDEIKKNVHGYVEISKSKYKRNIIRWWKWDKGIKDNLDTIVMLCHVPDNICDYVTLSEIMNVENISVRTKIIILNNVTDIVTTLYDCFTTNMKRIAADCIYVNPKDGSVLFMFERSLDQNINISNYEKDSFFLEISESNGLTEQMLIRFLAFVSFMFLCNRNPYDVPEYMALYPLLTTKASQIINNGEKGFILSETNIVYVNDELCKKKWRYLPTYFRKVICSELNKGKDASQIMDLKQWQSQIRMLRDSLIIVKSKPVFYDWETQQSLLLIRCNDYLVPVWPRKAVYWYHISSSDINYDNPIVGGIDADMNLRNQSNFVWTYTRAGKRGNLYSGQSVKLEAGLSIIIDNQEIKVLDGDDINGRKEKGGGLNSVILNTNSDKLIDEDIMRMLDDNRRRRYGQ